MKHITMLLVGFLLFSITAFSKDVEGKTYRFTIPENAAFKYIEQLEMYDFQWHLPEGRSEFTFFRFNPTPSPFEDIYSVADLTGMKLENKLKQNEQITEAKQKKTEIDLGPFKGLEIEFLIQYEIGMTVKAYTLILHDGSHIWHGTLLSADSTNDLAQIHTILKTAKRIATQKRKIAE